MSAYRSFYDYRKSYEPRSSSSTISSSNTSSTTNKPVEKSSLTKKSNNDDKSESSASSLKYSSSYRRFPQTTSSNTSKSSSSDSKISKEIREKYGPDGYTPRTDPPVSYHNSRRDSVSRLGISSTGSSAPRSRGTSPVTGPKTELYSSYTPYRSTLSTPKTTRDTSNSRCASREDVSRIGTVSSLGTNRFRTTSTSRGSREDLSRIGTTSASSRSTSSSLKPTTKTTSLSRRNSKEELNKIGVGSTSSLSRRSSREDLHKIGNASSLRYSGSSSTSSRYSTPSASKSSYLQRKSPAPNLSSSTPSYGSRSRSTSQDVSSIKTLIDDPPQTKATTPSSSDTVSTDVDEIITITVVTRGTSPNPPSQTPLSAYNRSKRCDVARLLQKDISRPKKRPEMFDKEVQSDRTDDTARYSRFGSGRLTTSHAPWNSYLDLKFSSPSNSYTKYSRSNSGTTPKESTPSSPSTASKTSPSWSISKTPPKDNSEEAETKSSKSETKSKSKTPLKNSSESKESRSSPVKLPPTVPKSTNSIGSNSNQSKPNYQSQHSLETINKDFRKSTLNMNQYATQKSRSKSSAASSSDSESTNSSTKDPIKNSSSKNVKVSLKAPSRSRSTSVDSTSSLSVASKPEVPLARSKSRSAKLDDVSQNTELSKSDSRTSQGISEIINDESSKVDSNSNKPKYRIKPIESGERAWWLNDDTNNEKTKSPEQESPKLKYKIKPIESGERAWWLNSPEKSDNNSKKYTIKPIESGERAWWLNDDEKSETKKDDVSPVRVIRPIESGERAWWLKSDSAEKSNDKSKTSIESPPKRPTGLGHAPSADKAWWLHSDKNIAEKAQTIRKSADRSSDEDEESSSEELENYVIDTQLIQEPLGDRLSPDGIETACEDEMYTRRIHSTQFISKHTNIDDLLNIEPVKDVRYDKADNLSCYKLDDSALQLYKDGDYGAYLDLEASINEQQEEFEGFQDNRKNSIILRTQLSVRVHSIIEKLLNSESRELRRSLFSLKQIFQEDKDLVHEFVQNDGLSCLIKVGMEVDQNYQNYILRALGQLMLYVDGMNGVMEHNLTVQWLYSLIASKFRLVVKTALKLLLVFVEYVETNCMLLIQAIDAVDSTNEVPTWSVIMRLLKDYDSADTELLIYAMTLINKCLNGIPDQDTYYDQVDSLEEQGIESVIQRYMSRQGTDLDLLRQFQIYEAVLEHEDGEQKNTPLDETIRKTLRNRKSVPMTCERRKSRRHSTGTSAIVVKLNHYKSPTAFPEQRSDGEDESSSSQSSHGCEQLNGKYNDNKETNQAGVTPALRRRRERAERQRSFIREQESNGIFNSRDDKSNKNITDLQRNNSNGSVKHFSPRGTLTPQLSGDKLEQIEQESQEINGNSINNNGILKNPWVLSMMYSKSQHDENHHNEENSQLSPVNNNEANNHLIHLNKENSVKDLTQKLSSQNILHSSPVEENNRPNRIGDMTGLIFKAKEGLAKSKSKIDVLRSPTSECVPKFSVPEVKKTESELHWEELARTLDRPLNLCDLDFTDLGSGDENDILAPSSSIHAGPPPPPPPNKDMVPQAPPAGPPSCPPVFSSPFKGLDRATNDSTTKNGTNKKNKKTVKLFWKEVRDDPISVMKLQNVGGMIWDELTPVIIDTQKLEHLFESRAKDSLTKKQQELNKNKEIIILDHKRSNAINIGMTKLPPPRSIKTAILKMDATIMNREGIEKLLTMLPTEEERTRIQDAQAANPDLPLGSAEQFLLTLASISELPARLKLWAFKLDFESSEREIAEPLMDLKQGIELLRVNKTFRGILRTLLSIGIFLNGSDVKGFQIEYLAKVPEVKDTVHKHSLLHHLCYMVMEKFPESTDLYSEIGAITRVSKVDFDELRHNIQRLEIDCKASWDHLKLIAKHDGSTFMKVKMSDFLADCAERIILLSIIHRRVINRYNKFLLWVGVPLHQVADTKPNQFCRIVSEFALEYRTTRERVLQQLEKKANHRERNKTRGKMITEVGKFSSKEERADAELRHVLGTSDISDVEGGTGTLPWRRRREQSSRTGSKLILNGGGDLTDADDEILESLVKTATKAPSSRTVPRERKRTRNVDRKSMRRTLKNGLSEDEKKHLAAIIKGY